LPALLVEALDEPVVVTIDGERREITKREAVVTQLVNKSTGAELHATKMLIDTLKDAEKKAGVAPPSEPARSPRPTMRSWSPSSQGCGNPGRRSFKRGARRIPGRCPNDDGRRQVHPERIRDLAAGSISSASRSVASAS
jgi:hypothetical protein